MRKMNGGSPKSPINTKSSKTNTNPKTKCDENRKPKGFFDSVMEIVKASAILIKNLMALLVTLTTLGVCGPNTGAHFAVAWERFSQWINVETATLESFGAVAFLVTINMVSGVYMWRHLKEKSKSHGVTYMLAFFGGGLGGSTVIYFFQLQKRTFLRCYGFFTFIGLGIFCFYLMYPVYTMHTVATLWASFLATFLSILAMIPADKLPAGAIVPGA
jgi:hypothetical protein